jgi:hypothetical protein
MPQDSLYTKEVVHMDFQKRGFVVITFDLGVVFGGTSGIVYAASMGKR